MIRRIVLPSSAQARGERLAERWKGFVRVTLARHKVGVPFFHVGQCAEAVIFRLEQPVRVVESSRSCASGMGMIVGVGKLYQFSRAVCAA